MNWIECFNRIGQRVIQFYIHNKTTLLFYENRTRFPIISCPILQKSLLFCSDTFRVERCSEYVIALQPTPSWLPKKVFVESLNVFIIV